jgi:hypothetical protein
MYKLFIVLILVGCGVADPIVGPSSSTTPPLTSDTLVVVPPVVPTTPTNIPFASPKNSLWNEIGPIGFMFSLNTQWGQAIEDTTAFRYGWKSQKFIVNYGECFGSDCFRAPVYERKEYGEMHSAAAVEGDEFWYGWSFYVPLESSNPAVFFGQFIQPPADSSVGHDAIWMLRKTNQQPFCMVFDWVNHSDAFQHCDTPNISLISDVDFAGKWHDLVFHIIWSHDNSKGLTEVWVDGNLKGVRRGYTLTPNHIGALVKYGIYRSTHNKPTIVYYDEIRKGKTRQEVDIRMLTSP